MALDSTLTTMDPADQAAFDAMRDGGSPAPAATTDPEPAPTAPPPAAPAEAAAQPTKDGDPQRQQTVPHGALHEERERRKEIERKAQENERKWEERFNALLQRVAQPPQAQPATPDQPQIPDITADPVGHFRAKTEMLERQLAQVVGVEQSRQQMSEQARQFQAVAEAAQVAERQFMATTPDYNDAALHLKNTRAAELQVMGFNPVEADRIISQEAMNIAQAALQRRQNPAEIIYNLAKQRGYAGKAPAPEAQPAPAASAPAPSAAQKLDQLAAGQEQATSLSRTRGAAPSPLTAARLLEMSDDEFHKIANTPEGRALFGA